MDATHLEKLTEERARRRMKKRKPAMRMSGKRTREVPKLWKKRAGR